MPFDIDVFLSQLMDYDKYINPDTVQAASRAAMQFAPAGPQLVKAAEFLETGGGARPDLLAPTPGAELGGAAVEEKAEQDRLVQEQRVYDIKAASDKARQAQQDELSSLVSDMPADTLWKIRAEARQRGRQGSLEYGEPPTFEDIEETRYAKQPTYGGGTLTEAKMTPELQQRLDDNASWLADQPIRDAQFALTPEQSQRDPRSAAMASDRLVGLQLARTREKEAVAQEKLITSMAGKSGKIPFESAMQLMAGRMHVPAQMVGLSPDQADREISQIIEAAGAGMMSRDVLVDPTGSKAMFEKHSLMLANAAKEQLAAGGDRDIIVPQLRVEIRNLILSLGLGNVANMGEINKQLGIPEGQ